MDILHLIDRLEETFKSSKNLPFSNLRLVDERLLWPLLDQMRISIPDEVRRAERIIREKERTMAQAHEEAEHRRAGTQRGGPTHGRAQHRPGRRDAGGCHPRAGRAGGGNHPHWSR